MYRQYENPRGLEKQLEEKKARYEELKAKVDNGELDFDVLVDAQLDIDELTERVNFAWQDEEYEEDYARENGLVNEPFTEEERANATSGRVYTEINPLFDDEFMDFDDEDMLI